MSKPRRNPRDRFAQYVGQRCAVAKCYRPRSGVSQWCSRHRQTAARWGHPTARRLLERELRPYWVLAGRVLKKYGDDPATQQALEIMAALIIPSPNPPKLITILGRPTNPLSSPAYLAWRELMRCQEAVDADGKPWPLHEREALRAALSVVLFGARNPSRLPNDTALDHALAHEIYRLRPAKSYHKRTKQRGRQNKDGTVTVTHRAPGQAKKYLGRLVRQQLWKYFEGCCRWLQAESLRKASTAEAMAAFLDKREEERKAAEQEYMRRGTEAVLFQQAKALATLGGVAATTVNGTDQHEAAKEAP